MIYITLFGGLIFLANSIFYRQLTPSYLATMFWSVQVIIAIIFINDSFYGLHDALIWLWFVLFSCLLFGIDTNVKRKNIALNVSIDIIKARKGIIVQCLLAYICVVLNINAHGFDFHSFLSLNSLAEANNEMAINRYSGTEGGSFLAQLLLMFVYSSCISVGYLKGFSDEKLIKLILMAIVPSILIVFSLNTKAVFLTSVIFLLVGYVVGIKTSKKTIELNTVKIIKLIAILIIPICILVFSMMLRIGSVDIPTFEIVMHKFISYSLAHIPAFCYWFQNNIAIEYSLGEKTFIGPLSILGINERIQGVYSDFWSDGNLMTNVYSYFRGLIEDFGMIGGALAFVIIVMMGNYAYKGYLSGGNKNICITVLTFVYCFIFFWPVSLCTYVSLIASFFCFFIFLKTSMVFSDDKR